MKLKTCVLALIVMGLAAGLYADGDADRGSQDMSLYGGKRGNVPFPHHLHQDTLGNCDACHTVFAQESGIIETLKKEEKLRPKHVMNKLCVKCHREQAKAGNPSGPRSCNACHIKEYQPPA